MAREEVNSDGFKLINEVDIEKDIFVYFFMFYPIQYLEV